MPLGDWVNRITTNLGVKPCTPCQKRQAMLNHYQNNVVEKIKAFFVNTPPQSPPSPPPS